jgi:hypothetical protein
MSRNRIGLTSLVSAYVALSVLIGVGPVDGRSAAQHSANLQRNALDELQRAERKWRASKISAYEFRFQYSCGMIPPPPPGAPPILIRVKDRTVTYPRPEPFVPVAAELVQYSTVERLFAFIRKAWTSHPSNVDVKYDRDRGYPIRVCVDPVADVTDDEHGFDIKDFSVLANLGQ